MTNSTRQTLATNQALNEALRRTESTTAPTHWLFAPHSLLLASGALLGMRTPIGKLAHDAGVSALLWAAIISLGVVIMLLPTQLTKRGLRLPDTSVVRYTMISSLISFVLPNVLLFTVIPRVGAGYAGLMFALSPVFTLLFASLFGMKTPGRLGMAGIAIGVVGALLVSLTRGTHPQGPELAWLLAAAAIPVVLAIGNVYRSRWWPEGALPNSLAFWGHLFAAGVFLVIIAATGQELPVAGIASAKTLIVIQMVISGLNFPLFYRLQRDGGPVLLSQIGYVSAAVSLIVATVFLGERYALSTWLGAGIIGVGIIATVMAQRLESQVPVQLKEGAMK
ncbi:MAG: DMT family transporter [Haliea sp.]|uniref:DMT family transporter n=1 Tax=Haliea sp. TaxID=1932666 RepID=UPI0032EBD454